MKALALTLLISASATAETSLVLGGFSYHIGEREYEEVDSNGYSRGVFKPYNEVNTAIGLCNNDNCLVASKLSYDNWGVAAYHEFTALSTSYADFGFRLGVIWGYEDTPQGGLINPLVSPVVSIPIYNWAVQVGVIPTSPMPVTVNVKYKF